MRTSDNICSTDKLAPREKYGARVRRTPRRCENISGMDSLPLPDLYLIDSRKLLQEVHRIRQLALAIPPSVEGHSAQQTVLDALWRLESDMGEILKVQAAIHRSFTEKAEKLTEASQPVRVGLRVVS